MSLLSIKNLSVETAYDSRVLVNNVSLEIEKGEAIGVVGESGSGKTLSALSILGLLPRGVQISSGSILYNGKDLVTCDSETLRSIRGREISMIYQDPMTALNPVMKLGDQLREVKGPRAQEQGERKPNNHRNNRNRNRPRKNDNGSPNQTPSA